MRRGVAFQCRDKHFYTKTARRSVYTLKDGFQNNIPTDRKRTENPKNSLSSFNGFPKTGLGVSFLASNAFVNTNAKYFLLPNGHNAVNVVPIVAACRWFIFTVPINWTV